MIKTSYQAPELRDANDNIIQSGAFGKNTALSNSTNDGWIDYVMNNLEALHDVVGETSPTLDGNGHVVEPANLAIGDEDGNRIKNSYLKLSGGKVTGIASFRTDLRMLDNQDNRWGGLYVPGTTSSVQYLSLYSGTRATGDARLNLYNTGNGKFELTGYSTNGANAYTLTNDNSGNLNWRGYPLAWKKDYLPLAGGSMTGTLEMSGKTIHFVDGSNPAIAGSGGWIGPTENGVRIAAENYGYSQSGGRIELRGRNYATDAGRFDIIAADNNNSKSLTGKPNGTLKWGSDDIALAKNFLPLSGGTMTGDVTLNDKAVIVSKAGYTSIFSTVGSGTDYGVGILSKRGSFSDSHLILRSGEQSTDARFQLAAGDGTSYKSLVGKPNGALAWNGNQLGFQGCTNTRVTLTSASSTYTFTFGGEIVTIMAKRDSSYVMYLVDYWGAGAAKVVSGGNNNLISVEHEPSTRTVTITRDPNALAVPVQIIHSDIAW